MALGHRNTKHTRDPHEKDNGFIPKGTVLMCEGCHSPMYALTRDFYNPFIIGWYNLESPEPEKYHSPRYQKFDPDICPHCGRVNANNEALMKLLTPVFEKTAHKVRIRRETA